LKAFIVITLETGGCYHFGWVQPTC